MVTIRQISEWNIEDIGKRLIEIQAAADGDCHFSHYNGTELLLIAQRAAELVKEFGKVIASEINQELIDEVEALRERVVKLSAWLNEHENALAKSRRETNNANRCVAKLEKDL